MTTEVLFANKFKSVEDLEKGYRESSAEAVKLKQNETTLQNQLSEYAVPENYAVPDEYKGISQADIDANVAIAKSAGLSQKQFAGLLKGIGETAKSRETQAEEARTKKANEYAAARAKLDPKELDVLESFVSEMLPEELAAQAKQSIVDPNTFQKLKGLREKIVNTTLPGMTSVNPAPAAPQGYDPERLRKAYEATEANPSDTKLRDAFIAEINKKVAHEKDLPKQPSMLIY